ncbi:hypothetical protein BcFMB_00070 [Bifidobacterium choerinum]|uniref:Uncharacterized protein n=2 Tax=Bifidobacterium choerinum TaxID=35760 RepID=A0A2D3D397_9BIFI|nr:hypothetical protein BcFMB_00070 [Bifidobacterium choerinum]
MTARNITQADLQKALGDRSKGYISDRVLGKRSWAISELDRIAHLFALPDALSLIAAASGSAGIAESSTATTVAEDDPQWIADHLDQFDIAAKHGDTEAEQQAYEELP